MKWTLLLMGGAAGSLARYALGSAVHGLRETPFPFGTLAVNVVGCLIVGFLSSAGGVRFTLTEEARLLLITGFCGAFTTFSALILETVALSRAGSPGLAAGYVGASIALGILSFLAGAALGRLL